MPLLKMRRQEIEGPGQARGTVTKLILTLFPKDVRTTNTPWGLPNLPFQLGGNRVETGQANYKQGQAGTTEPGRCQNQSSQWPCARTTATDYVPGASIHRLGPCRHPGSKPPRAGMAHLPSFLKITPLLPTHPWQPPGS